MGVITIPELLVPGELVAQDGHGDGFVQLLAGGLPNGEDCLRIMSGPGSEKLRVEQDALVPTHMLKQGDGTEMAMSFWIRRHQNFEPFDWITSSTSGDHSSRGPVLFGVGEPFTIGVSANDNILAWAVIPYSNSSIGLMYKGWAHNRRVWFMASTVPLDLGEWTFFVANVSNLGFQARFDLEHWKNSYHVDTLSSVGSSYYAAPHWTDLPNSRFALGDPTGNERALKGEADGPLYDIGKLTFHDRNLTRAEQLDMYESMLYGGAAA